MNGEPIVVLLSDGRTINLQHVIATQRLTKVVRRSNPQTGLPDKESTSVEVIQNFGNNTFDASAETHMLQVQTGRGWDISILDKDDIALFDGAWYSYCMFANRKAAVRMGGTNYTPQYDMDSHANQKKPRI